MRYTHKITYIALLLLFPLTVSSAGFKNEPFAGVSEQPATNNIQADAFKSVSSRNLNQQADAGWRASSYSVPFAAQDISGGLTTDDTSYEIESAFGPRRIPKPDYDEEEPGGPIGDVPWIMMLLLAGGYIVYTARKRQRLCSSEKK